MGATATMVATQRALATRERLIDDPFAEPLVHAVDNDYFNRLVDGEIDLAELDPEFSVRRSAKSMAVRTRFFDRMFTDAAAAGVRQAVILAAGLDARAYRLRWPEGRRCTKWTSPTSSNSRLERWPNWWPNLPRSTGPSPSICETIGVKHCGQRFNATAPTARSPEGLLIYLPPAAQDQLFDTITELSARGNRLATEDIPDMNVFSDERSQRIKERMKKFGHGIDFADLIYDGERSHVVEF